MIKTSIHQIPEWEAAVHRGSNIDMQLRNSNLTNRINKPVKSTGDEFQKVLDQAVIDNRKNEARNE